MTITAEIGDWLDLEIQQNGNENLLPVLTWGLLDDHEGVVPIRAI